MKFTQSQFNEAVELLQASGGAKTRKDNRRAQRKSVRVVVQLRLNNDPDSPWFEAQLRDISPRGAQLRCDRPLTVNDSFLLRLPGKDGKPSASSLLCRVAHCKSEKDQFTIGAEFIGQATSKPAPSSDEKELDRIRRSILG
jgi:PilZ domain